MDDILGEKLIDNEIREKPSEKLEETPKDISIEKRKQELKTKINKFIDTKEKWIFLGILIFGIIIRLYYFFLTKNQPLWFDEADYMAYAKNIGGYNNTWITNPQHMSLFPFLAGILFRLGLNEISIKFLLEFLPSVLLIYLVYKICSLMYENKKIALISSFLMAILWTILFNTFRFHMGIPALFLGFLAILIFWQGYVKEQKIIFGKTHPKYTIILVSILVVLTYSIRRGYFWFGFFFLFYMLITKDFKSLIKDRYNWIAAGILILLLFLLHFLIFPAAFESTTSNQSITGTEILKESFYNYVILRWKNYDFNLLPFTIFGDYFKNINNSILSPLFYLFWIGFIVVIGKMIISFGYFKKMNNQSKADLFNILCILIVLGWFLFFQIRPIEQGLAGEPRWYFPLLLSSFIVISKAAIWIENYAKQYNKILGISIIIILLGFGAYHEINHADMIIKNKLPSYEGVKNSALYLKEISHPDDVIISIAMPQVSYYSERQVENFATYLGIQHNRDISLEQGIEILKNHPEAKYLIVSLIEPGNPEWMKKQIIENNQIIGYEIPFMQTTLTTQNQDIKREVSYNGIKFRFIEKQFNGVLLYEIIRE